MRSCDVSSAELVSASNSFNAEVLMVEPTCMRRYCVQDVGVHDRYI